MYKLNYEQTDKKIEIEIFGIKFDLPKITQEMQADLQKIVEDKNNDFNIHVVVIDRFLGEGSFEKINQKRFADGYAELDLLGSTQVVCFVQEIITKEIDKVTKTSTNKINQIHKNKPYNKNHK